MTAAVLRATLIVARRPGQSKKVGHGFRVRFRYNADAAPGRRGIADGQ